MAGARWLLAVSILGAAALPADSVLAIDGQSSAARETAPVGSVAYYIEFRAARIGTYGHSYVVYGKLNARGEPASLHYTDRHPVGNYALMALGHVLPVPANTSWNPEVLTLPVSSSYRHRLTAAQYQNLVRAVRRAQAEKNPTWNAISNNCNHYVAALARAAGLKAPADLQLSYQFVPTLRDLNMQAEGRPGRASGREAGERGSPSPRI